MCGGEGPILLVSVGVCAEQRSHLTCASTNVQKKGATLSVSTDMRVCVWGGGSHILSVSTSMCVRGKGSILPVSTSVCAEQKAYLTVNYVELCVRGRRSNLTGKCRRVCGAKVPSYISASTNVQKKGATLSVSTDMRVCVWWGGGSHILPVSTSMCVRGKGPILPVNGGGMCVCAEKRSNLFIKFRHIARGKGTVPVSVGISTGQSHSSDKCRYIAGQSHSSDKCRYIYAGQSHSSGKCRYIYAGQSHSSGKCRNIYAGQSHSSDKCRYIYAGQSHSSGKCRYIYAGQSYSSDKCRHMCAGQRHSSGKCRYIYAGQSHSSDKCRHMCAGQSHSSGKCRHMYAGKSQFW